MDVIGYAVHGEREKLAPLEFSTRDVGPADVAVSIEWSGVCHSDIHTGRSEWGEVLFPCVPGHEIVGRVVEVGSDVTKFSVGQRVHVCQLIHQNQPDSPPGELPGLAQPLVFPIESGTPSVAGARENRNQDDRLNHHTESGPNT